MNKIEYDNSSIISLFSIMDTALFIIIFYPSLALILICCIASFFAHNETRDQQFARWEAERKDYVDKAAIPYWDAHYTVSNHTRQERLAYHPGNPNRNGCVIL